MEINGDAGLTVSEWEIIKQLAQFALDAKDKKVGGVSIKISTIELEDCRSIIRKAKEFT